jgi:hypothetical protein
MSLIAGGVISAVATLIIGGLYARSQSVRVREYLRPGQLARMVS